MNTHGCMTSIQES